MPNPTASTLGPRNTPGGTINPFNQGQSPETWFPLNPQQVTMPINPGGLVNPPGLAPMHDFNLSYGALNDGRRDWGVSSEVEHPWKANYRNVYGGVSGMGLYLGTNTYAASSAGQAGVVGLTGLGCDCGCNGAGTCGTPGMGTLGDGTGLFNSGLFNGQGLMGSGLFEGGWDLSTWGGGEWAALAIGLYVVYSVLHTTGQGLSYGRSIPGRTRRAARATKSAFL